ncbi:MAG: IS21 family transposase [Fibrobacteria bacterium]|nr:IS21 family transposase [Fibrobacteria bacterium]
MSRLDQNTLKKIRLTFKETGNIRETARRLGISRNAVRRELRRRPGDSASSSPIRRASKLDPYKAKIKYLVIQKDLSAVRVQEEIQELGYEGGYSILKDFIKTIRPHNRRGATAPIEHAPGHEAQMDWSPHRVDLGGRETIVHTGSIILCFSRLLYLNFFLDETIDSVISLHEEAFKAIDGVPATITYDNMTTVGKHIGPKEVWLNPIFSAFAKKYGFEIIILPPGAKDRHGMVERPFHYIEHNCLKGREFNDLEQLQNHGQWWLEKRANVRIHGSLRERPLDRFGRERSFLNPLPSKRFEAYRQVERLVHRDFCLSLETNRYSVHPKFVGRQAKVRLFRDYLQIWIDEVLVASHTYVEGRHQRQVLPEHEAAFKGSCFQTELLKNAFIRLGKEAGTYFEGLKRMKGKAAGYHLQRILKLAQRHGSDVVAGALSHTQRYGVYSAEAVSRVIHGKALRQKGNVQTVEDIPENIRQWLRSCAVEEQNLSTYDEMLEESNDDEDNEEK